MEIELTTMCAVVNKEQVLMINRSKNWKGWAFPGGHIEGGESAKACVVREIFEEAGIVIHNPEFLGITNIYNPELLKRHIIFNYLATSYEGKAKDACAEGELKWVNLDSIKQYDMAEGMEYRLPLFFSAGTKELYIEWNERNGYTKVEYR